MERYRAIATPDELDPSFKVPCRRCAELLQEGNRFCPFCFEDQLAPAAAGEAGSALKAQADSPAGAERPSPDGFDFMDTVQPGAKGPDAGMGLVGSDQYWQTEVLGGGGKTHWAARFTTPRRLVLGIVSVLVLVALAFLGFGRPYFDDQDAAGRRQALRADVERVQTALNRGDLGTAQQVLEVLEADHADDPGVQTLREAFDLRVQERSARLVQATPPAAPPAVVSAPATATAAAKEKGCSEALAALALCPQN